MKNRTIVVVLLLLVLLTSCTSVWVDFGSGAGFRLLGFDFEYQFPIEEYQLIYGSFPYIGDDMAFESWTKVDGNSVSMVAFLPTGQTFAEIEWDGKNLKYESSYMPQGKFFAQYIVNDLQMCYAPINAIENNIAGSGLTIVESTVGNVKTRTLKKGNETVSQITYEDGIICVENLSTGYSYKIETL